MATPDNAFRMHGNWSVRRWLPVLFIAALQPLLWKLRIHDPASVSAGAGLPLGVIDHYIEHQPMVTLVSRRLAAGEFPLWNPHELCGIPLFAGLQVGILYPPNLIFVLFDAPLASDLLLIAHLAFAALCVYGLARTWEAPPLAALAAGLSFAWCARINTIVNQHSPLMALTWMPLTVWLVELSLRKKRHAVVGLALAVCTQILVGSFEAVVFNLEAAGLYAVFRLAPGILGTERVASLRSGLALLIAVGLGIALAAPLLLPAAELILRSNRIDVTLDEARGVGTIPLADLGAMLLSNVNRLDQKWVHVHAGVLSLLAVTLGLGMRAHRSLYLYAITLCVFGALMTEGGAVFELYTSTPIGENLRRPWKFLVFLALGMALLTAIGVTRLLAWSQRGMQPSWKTPTWLATLALCLVLGAFAARDGGVVPYAIAAGGLLILAALRWPAACRTIVLGLVALHVVQLFFAFENSGMRAIHRPEALYRERDMWRELAERAGNERILISGRLFRDPAFVQKQGAIHGFYATGGYDALISREHARFFDAAGLRTILGYRFFGTSALTTDVDWSLVDRTSTRFVVLQRNEQLATRLQNPRIRRSLGFRSVTLDNPSRAVVYQRDSAFPRARFTADFVLAGGPASAAAALAALSPGARQVVLEASKAEVGRSPSPRANGSVKITSLEAERIVLEVEAGVPGFVVLSDSWNPGWKARVDGRVVPILRADILFRAVAVPEGISRVELDFQPRSLVLGAGVAAVAAALLVLVYLVETRWWVEGTVRRTQATGTKPAPPSTRPGGP